VAVLAASGLAVAAAGAVALFGGRWSDWTHADLITRLESKGIPVAAVRSDRGPGLSMYFFTGGVEYEYRQLAVMFDDGMGVGKIQMHGQVVRVSKMDSSAQARDEAATRGERGFAWRRFLFDGDPGFIEKIKAALP
jgi:hypothetical protein